jgi:hypothetical protein
MQPSESGPGRSSAAYPFGEDRPKRAPTRLPLAALVLMQLNPTIFIFAIF